MHLLHLVETTGNIIAFLLLQLYDSKQYCPTSDYNHSSMSTQPPLSNTSHSITTASTNNTNSPCSYSIDEANRIIPQLNDLNVTSPPPASQQSQSRLIKSLSHEQLSRRRLSVIGDQSEQLSIDGRQRSDEGTCNGGTQAYNDTLNEYSINKKHRTYKVYSHTKTGYIPFNTKKVNQDRICITELSYNNILLYGVFDGHGVNGHLVSQYLVDTLPNILSEQLRQYDVDDTTDHKIVEQCLVKSFELVNQLLIDSVDCYYSGSTAVISLLLNNNKLIVANTGDSRCMIARRHKNNKLRALELSIDHKPEIPAEKQRIIQSNGRVQPCYDARGQALGPDRVWLKHAATPGLGMSRAMGDTLASSVGVICIPEIQYHNIDDNDEFMLMCSDGVTELLTSNEAIKIVSSCSDPSIAANVLVDESVKAWEQQEQVIDDITCILILFK